jgi:nicotinic acid mononucleotide adenylyltransferase
MLLTLDSWKNPDVIFDLATICFVRRESDSENDAIIEKKISEYEERFSARIIALDHDVLETSSTELRRNVGAGATRLSCIPDRVARYIAKKGLYR